MSKSEELRRRAMAAHDRISDEEDAALHAAAVADPDNPPLPDILPPRRGRPKSEHPKQYVPLRIDADVVERFKAGGPGWQSRMNEALRKAAGL
ncbi:MAG: hypothetical protein EOR68_08420 [Mesorhizobium sp.]|uniref:BrnA antitoxin family protein n=1 Tax=Mesorhizobium sp. TaxID=1871066 RepID=UPI000FE75318|nr:BrnA antitoxin family protein [Mesorhizobium sp.]RWM02121.1 MAG: hypothetical protein EOR68_08420 [Mesorhizobium sp.]